MTVLLFIFISYIFWSYMLFQTIPVASAPSSLPQMELPDSGLTYFPWAQPLTTISTMPSPGVQFAQGSTTLPGSPVVHMPLSMSLATMIPQMESQGVDPHPEILELPQRSDHQLDPVQQDHSLDEDSVVEPGSPNLLDKLLEDQKEDGEEEGKDSFSSSLFIQHVWLCSFCLWKQYVFCSYLESQYLSC